MASNSQETTNQSPIPPACNQCRTRKVKCRREQPVCSNCVRSGLTCDFNMPSKRVNHTKRLAQDFSQLSSKLERIDKTLLMINQRLDAPHSTLHSSSVSVSTDDYADRLPQPDSPQAFADGDMIVLEDVHVHHLDSNSVEHYFGPTSLQALLQATRNILQHKSSGLARHASHAATSATLNTIDLSFPEILTSCEYAEHGGQRFSKVPYELAYSGMIAYMATWNVISPIFDGDHFNSTVTSYYGSAGFQRNMALDICLSAMVVLTAQPITTESRTAHLNTCLHAVDSAVLMRSRMLEVQALALLYLVAGEHSLTGVAERALRKACYLLKVLGIESHTTEQDYPDKRIVYWFLFAADKQCAFLTGRSCDLHLADCDVPVPWTIAEGSNNAVYAARAHLFMIFEDIWARLYSVRARRQPTRYNVVETVGRLDIKLRTWYERHKDHLDTARAADLPSRPIAAAKLELQYCLHLARLLVYRRGHTLNAKEVRLNSARAALKTIVQLSSQSEALSIMLTRRLARHNSPLAFFCLVYELLSSPGAGSLADFTLLHQVCQAIQSSTQGFSDQSTYFIHLIISMRWCLSVNKVVIMAARLSMPPLLDGILPSLASDDQASSKRPSTSDPDLFGRYTGIIDATQSQQGDRQPWMYDTVPEQPMNQHYFHHTTQQADSGPRLHDSFDTMTEVGMVNDDFIVSDMVEDFYQHDTAQEGGAVVTDAHAGEEHSDGYYGMNSR